MVAGLHVADELAHVLDDARRLVPQHARHGAGVGAVEEVHVGMAHARRGGAHEHLARPRLVDLHLLDVHRRVDGTEYGCLHDSSSLRRCRS